MKKKKKKKKKNDDISFSVQISIAKLPSSTAATNAQDRHHFPPASLEYRRPCGEGDVAWEFNSCV